MRITDFNEGLIKIGCIKSEIKNKNEIYALCTPFNIEAITFLLVKQYKLKFISEFCLETDIENRYYINVSLNNSKEGFFVVLRYETEDLIISLQNIFNQAHLFEREISDLFGLTINGGSEKRHLAKHEIWEDHVYPLTKKFTYKDKIKQDFETPTYKFKPIVGDEAFQISVGPIHAGVIEPGHFRFSVIGEDIENLEIRLNYKHRGIEKMAENIDANQLNLLVERIACESSLAYAEVYALLIEKMLDYKVSDDIKALRVALLEMERLYNYMSDIAGICVDIGFSYPAKKFNYFSELIKQLAERVTGSRYMRQTIIPMGINLDFDTQKKRDIQTTLEKILPRMKKIINATLESFTFLDRVENTGIVNRPVAKKLLLTGIVGRASGLNYDVRKSFPYEIYSDIKKHNNIEEIGGVFERYKLKIAEIMDGFEFINIALDRINGDIKKDRPNIGIEAGTEAIAMVETVKGELMIYGKAGSHNKFDRLYFKTPSFTNWNGLCVAVLDEIVPDFPLCNKSFNMSYSENDR